MGTGRRSGNPGLKGKLINKSIEAYVLSLETINRLSITYRVETFAYGIAHRIIERADNSRNADWAVLDIGAIVCLPRRPRCGECPLASQCLALRAGQVT